jgi:hypothetical protein
MDGEGDNTDNKSSEKRKHQLLQVGILLSCVFPRRETTEGWCNPPLRRPFAPQPAGISLTRAPFLAGASEIEEGRTDLVCENNHRPALLWVIVGPFVPTLPFSFALWLLFVPRRRLSAAQRLGLTCRHMRRETCENMFACSFLVERNDLAIGLVCLAHLLRPPTDAMLCLHVAGWRVFAARAQADNCVIGCRMIKDSSWQSW